METIVDIIKFIWQDDITFWGLILIFVFCILCWANMRLVGLLNAILGVDD